MPQKPAPVHTGPVDDGWANKRVGSNTVPKRFDTKKEAESAGRMTAQREKTEHVVHKRDGTIGEKNSYGNDPFPPRG